MESERYMFIIYKTYISHITFMSEMLFSFEAFSLSLLVVGTIPDVETLLISVLQDIAKLRTPTFTSSGASMVFKSFLPVCGMILSGFYWTVGMT